MEYKLFINILNYVYFIEYEIRVFLVIWKINGIYGKLCFCC